MRDGICGTMKSLGMAVQVNVTAVSNVNVTALHWQPHSLFAHLLSSCLNTLLCCI